MAKIGAKRPRPQSSAAADEVESATSVRPWAASSRLARTLASPWFLLAALALAAAFRLANFAFLRGTPFVDKLQLDHLYYDAWAQRILAGDWAGGGGAFWADPLYAYFLAGLYAMAGHSLVFVRLVQCGLGVATTYLTAQLGYRVSGSAAVGNLAALLTAVFVPAIYYDATIEKTSLCLVLFSGALLLYFGGSIRSAFGAGIVLGGAILTRGNLLLLVPLGALALLTDPENRQTHKVRLLHASAFAVGALLIVGTVTVRNLTVSGTPVLITGNLGQNLYVGQVCSKGDGTYRCDFLRPDPLYEEADFRREAERRVGHALSGAETATYWRGEALRAMLANPRGVARRALHNLRMFFHQYENSDNHNIDAQAEFSLVLALPFLWMGQLFPFSVLGVFLTWRGNRNFRLLACVVGVYCMSMLPFMVFTRYRTTVLPCMALLAAAAILWLVERVGERSWRAVGSASGALLVLGMFSLSWPTWMAAAHTKSMGVTFHNMGEQYLVEGRTDNAIRVFERAVESAPEVVTASMRRLGELYRQRKDYARAESYMLRVLDRKPDSTLGRHALAQLYSDMVATDEYRNDPEVRAKLEQARAML